MHDDEAMRLINKTGTLEDSHTDTLIRAQVHATLALAEATRAGKTVTPENVWAVTVQNLQSFDPVIEVRALYLSRDSADILADEIKTDLNWDKDIVVDVAPMKVNF